MIKYCTDLHLLGVDFIDNAIMDAVESIIDNGDILVLGGDVFDTYRVGLSNTVFYDKIIDISRKAKHVYILTGNHDISQGVCSFRLFSYAESNITIVEDYFYEDIGGIRYHFLNHFRYNPTVKFNLSESSNVLFSHAEINNITEIPKSFSVFDRVFNGHIHDTGVFSNVVNTGSFRQTKINEDRKRKYLSIDGKEYKSFEFDTPVRVLEYEYKRGITIEDVPSIVKLFVHNVDEKQEVLDLAKEYKNVIFKTEVYNKTKEVVGKAKSIVRKNKKTTEIFKDYLKEYERRYKSGVDKDAMLLYFNKHGEDIKNNDVFDIVFEEISGENFKLFPSLSKTFYSNDGITLVKGVNKDEVDDIGNYSSNESGKTALRQAMEYAIKGSELKISPLRVGTKKGNVCFSFFVNKDRILFVRSFTQKTNDLRIEINGKEYNKDMTNTDKLITFYKDYPIKHFFDLLFLSNNDWIVSFFNPRSNQKSKILSELFPNRMTVTFNILSSINTRLSELKTIQKENTDKYNTIKTERKVRSEYIWNDYFETRRELVKNKYILSTLKEVEEVPKPKYTYEYVSSIARLTKTDKPIKPLDDNSYIVDGKYDIDYMQGILQKYNLYVEHLDRYTKALNSGYGIEDIVNFLENYENNKEIQTDRLESRIKSTEDKVNKLRDTYRDIQKKKETTLVCDACGQDIQNEEAINAYNKNIQEKLNEITDEGKELTNELEFLKKELRSAITNNESIVEFKDKYKNLSYSDAILYKEILSKDKPDEVVLQHNLSELIPKCIIYNSNLDKYNEYTSVVKEEIDAVKELDSIHAYDNYIKEVEDIKNKREQLNKSIEELQNKIEKAEISIRDYNKNTREEIKKLNLKSINYEVSSYSSLVEVMSNKRTFNFTNYYATIFLGEIEQVINSYLNTLFTRPIKVIIDEETNDFRFIDGQDERSYDDFSRGAKTKIEIALVLSLITIQCESGLSTNLMYIDEFLDSGVDETNINRVVDLLKEVFSDIGSILLVSHKNIEDIVDTILYVEREGGKSTLRITH